MSHESQKWVAVLEDKVTSQFGTEIDLDMGAGASEVFQIKAEFKFGEHSYLAVQTAAMAKDEEVEFLQVQLEDEELGLSSIEDDEEWEAVAEAYDDLLFADSEQP